MGLNSVLKDQARLVRRVAVGPRVEGRSLTTTDVSPWFRARLDLGAQPESNDPGGRARTVASPTLMVGRSDTQGNSLAKEDGGCIISAEDRIEVVSAQLGSATYEVTGDPQPMRKKTTVLGWLVTLTRADTRELSSP